MHNPDLESTREFWDANPCDGQPSLSQRLEFKYQKETWMVDYFEAISKFKNILEVGCGQGTDAISICRKMQPGGRYTGIDYSPQSVESALVSIEEAGDSLQVRPDLSVGNAEDLRFADDSFDCVTSIGVLHHTPGTQAAIDEVYRVLEPGGTVFIALYRLFSPKVLGAYALRALVRVVDAIVFQKGFVLKRVRSFGSDHALGTMILEGIGVPILKSYTRAEIKHMFSNFESVQIEAKGAGIPGADKVNQLFDRLPFNPFGYFWYIVAKKPL
ncbi:MAG: class I SAM-dependent methyltransferase [Candidatus Nitrohelix vancouverensis]|uniref:Class I SAM-dependent methyltransferase n=1 Tax=Candidatus Nitrohelix vancouverensis TaxID=2705534 RepID=A0A7T0C2E3_9BACT|nr:MAG: class I SAM-dependent methyltransferase [Candidatus Nitrohelix vancouverensis]